MSLRREGEAMQNPALGAVLLWSFAKAYSPRDGELKALPMHELYLVLALVLHADTRHVLLKTQKKSGIRIFERKLRSELRDGILGIGTRAVAWRKLTTSSLLLALQGGLLLLDDGSAEVLVSHSKKLRKSQINEQVSPMLKAAERFGYWCSEVTAQEVLSALKVTP